MKSSKLIIAALFATIFGGVFSVALGVNPSITIGALFALSFIPMSKLGVLNAGVIQEVFTKDIQESLLQNAAFVPFSVDYSSYIAYGLVHVPQSGSIPNVEVNRSSFPATIGQRTDTDLSFAMNQYTTDPILIPNLDELQTAYDKRQSVLGQHIATLTQTVGDQVAYSWAATLAGAIIPTTGSAVGDALAPGATGTRKAVTLADIQSLAKKLDKDNVPRMGRKLLMQTDMFYQLLSISEIVRASYNGFQLSGGVNVIQTGIVAQLYGFDIMIRPTVAVYATGATTPKAPGAATATTDQLACIAWHTSVVARGEQAPVVLTQSGDNGAGAPEYYGIILSMQMMLGSAILRSDLKGIATLVQVA